MEQERFNYFLQSINRNCQNKDNTFIIIYNDNGKWKVLTSYNQPIIFFDKDEATHYMWSWQERSGILSAYVKSNEI